MRQYPSAQELRDKTIPGLLVERAKETPHEVAFRAKRLGIYQERTWLEIHRMVGACATGLARLGLKRGDRVALMGDPCEEYIVSELAAQSRGAITFGIYPAASETELRYQLNDGEASLFIAQNQEFADRVLPLLPQLPHLRKIIIIDTRGLFGYDHPSLVRYPQLKQMGEETLQTNPNAFEESVNQVKPSDGSFIAYTSGTTGSPKGVLISHSKHLAAASAWIEHYPLLRQGPHRTVAYLPMANVFGKMTTLTLPLLAPVVPHFGEDLDDLGQTFFEIAPTLLFTVPGYLKRSLGRIFLSIESSSPLKKLLYRLALQIGHRHIKKVWQNRKNLCLALAYSIGYQMVFRPILHKMGFNKVRIAFSTGISLPFGVMALWQIYGLNLSEVYGMTEAAGCIVAVQDSYFPRPGNVGKALPCFDAKLSESGEILIRTGGTFEGYWNNSRLTGEVLNPDGWFHSEDAGERTPDGDLRIVGRSREAIRTLDGMTIHPVSIESLLKSNPYINEAVVFGHNRPYLSSLVEIDFETVADWASRNSIPFTGLTGLIEHPEIVTFIGAEIEKINRDLSSHEQIKAFRILPAELNPAEDGGPITSTRKVRREVMYNKFKELIESMY
jgi:long-chain acyl-CoA synthetase